MRKVFTFVAFAIGSTSVLANQLQCFTSKTTDVKITPDSKMEKLYAGTYKDYANEYANIYSNAKLGYIGQQTAWGSAFIGGSMLIRSAGGYNTGNDMKAGLISIAVVLVAGAVAAASEAIQRDNEYEYITIITNPNGEKTILDSHIVANYALNPEELEKYAQEEQAKFIAEKGSL